MSEEHCVVCGKPIPEGNQVCITHCYEAAANNIVENKIKNTLSAAINEFGADAQINMMFEEMSELQHALCKNLRGKNNEDNISEEIADVQIMLDQMKILFECEQKSKMYYSEKIKRLADNIGYNPEAERRW